MSTASSILAAITSAIQGVSSLGSERVIRGRPASLTEGPSPPICWIWAEQLEGEVGSDLTSYTRTLEVNVVAIPTVESSEYAAREDACFDLADAMVAAIEQSATLAALLTVAPVTGTKAEVSSAELPGVAVVAMVIRCQWISPAGNGL